MPVTRSRISVCFLNTESAWDCCLVKQVFWLETGVQWRFTRISTWSHTVPDELKEAWKKIKNFGFFGISRKFKIVLSQLKFTIDKMV